MVLKKGKTETEKTIEEMKLPKWLDDLITKKWFFYVATAVMVVLFVGFSLPASTRDNIANAIFTKTTIGVSNGVSNGVSKIPMGADGKVPSSGNSPPVIGTATPTPTKGQEKKTNFMTLEWWQKTGTVVYLDKLPKEIKVPSNDPAINVYLTDLSVDNDWIIRGIIDNRGLKNVEMGWGGGGCFIFLSQDYTSITGAGIGIIGGKKAEEALREDFRVNGMTKKKFVSRKPDKPPNIKSIAMLIPNTFAKPIRNG